MFSDTFVQAGPLITVWLQVRVLPGPPTKSMTSAVTRPCKFFAPPEIPTETILLCSCFEFRDVLISIVAAEFFQSRHGRMPAPKREVFIWLSLIRGRRVLTKPTA